VFDDIDRLAQDILDILLEPPANYLYAAVLLGSGFILWCPLVDRIPSLWILRTAKWATWIALLFLASLLLLAMNLFYQFFSWLRHRGKGPLVQK
jgi:membrane protein implicated in regulation of membrane protease activity